MDFNRFRQCCQAYGAGRHRWPTHDRVLFDHFVVTEEGRALLAMTERTDRFLDTYELSSLDDQASQSLLRDIVATSRPLWRRLAIPVGALAMCALLGLLVGFIQAERASDTQMIAQLLLGPTQTLEAGR
jgi:type VI protein secretion system component VasF